MLRLHACLVLFLPLWSCASEITNPEQPPWESVALVLGEEHLNCPLSLLILDSDRIVVASVTESRRIPQLAPIAPSSEWGCEIGGYEHGLGQDVELAIVRVNEAVVAPAAVEEMVLFGRRVPADRHSTLKGGERALFFLGAPTRGPRFSSDTDWAIRDVLEDRPIWSIREDASWSLDVFGKVTLPRSLRSEFGTRADSAALADVIATVKQHAELLFPRCELRFGINARESWFATLDESGVFRESRGELHRTARLEASSDSGPIHWNEEGPTKILQRLLELVRDLGSRVSLGSRFLHAPALVMHMQTTEGGYFFFLAVPFDKTGDQSPARQEAAVVLQDFIKAFDFWALPDRLESELSR